ncbi:MAG TPA: ABC transporter [Bacteroidetes bacterium]|nr:ABC transporter [Bacteroidota bacterium]
MKYLASLNKYFWKYRWRLGLGIIFIFLSNLFGVLTPQVVRFAVDETIDEVTKSHNSNTVVGNVFAHTILWTAALILGLALLRGLFLFFMRQTIIVMSRYIEFDQKNELYNHYQQLDSNFYKENATGDLMSRITEDVSRVRMYVGPAVMYVINTVILFAMVMVVMWNVNPELAMYALIPLPLLALCIFLLNSVIERKSEKIQQQLSTLTSAAQETFSGIRVLKAYTQEFLTEKFFEKENIEYKRRQMSLAKTESVFFPTIFLLVGLSTLLVIFIGGKKVIEGTITPGNIAEFVMYINMLTWPIASMGWVLAQVQRAAASQKRINEFLSVQPDIKNPTEEKSIPKGGIEFHRVSFTYRNTGITALKNISFRLLPGEKMAVIGRTGSGKSTLASLLTRHYDVSEGGILIGGKDVRALNLEELRSHVRVVPQDVFLFSDTVSNNISFGNDHVNNHTIKEYAVHASVANDIEQLPDAFETMVGERGVMLSGGQKQRITIARALISNPAVLVLDDCLSAVDSKTEYHILRQFNQLLEHKTAIVITHRIFSLLHFDKIIVLDKGSIVEEGKHEELLRRQGLYYQLYELQKQEEKNTL